MPDAPIDWTVILEDIFSAINQAVLLLDANGEIIYSSSAVLKVFGYSPEHMIGESLALVFTKEDMQHLYPNLLFLARKGQTFEGEIMMKRKNEVNFFAYIILKPCFDPNLNKTIIAACVQDIDRQKQFERIIRETRFEDLVKVANGVAHELRNPLVGIGGFAKRLLASCQANEAQKKYYDFIMNNVTKIEKIVKKINALVTMPKPVYAEESLEDLIGMAIESYREIMRRKNIDLVLMTEPMRIRLDRDMISNAISILIENAIDAISDRGSIHIETEDQDHHCHIRVRDTGLGIKPSDLPYLCIPFFSTKADGAGIDLALVKRIMEAHGGAIDIDSAPGSGSTFTLTVPRERRRKIRVESIETPLN